MYDAVNEFLVRKNGDVHEVLITHNFVIAWFVREVLGAPEWRWMTLNQAHCGLTVIAQKQGRPWTLLTHNDTGHLPVRAAHRHPRRDAGLIQRAPRAPAGRACSAQ